MPFVIKKKNDQFLLINADTNRILGKHNNMDDARQHQKAVYANYKESFLYTKEFANINEDEIMIEKFNPKESGSDIVKPSFLTINEFFTFIKKMFLGNPRTNVYKKDVFEKKFIGKLWDGQSIFFVDGNYVRDNVTVDFTFGATDITFPGIIPRNEIWIEDVPNMKDRIYVLFHVVIENLLVKHAKMKEPLAHAYAESFEDVSRNYMRLTNEDVEYTEKTFRKKLIGVLSDKTKLYLVDGFYVRKILNPTFSLGGHWYVYPTMCPKDEVWVEDLNSQREIDITLLHEVYEYTIQKYMKWKYEPAHEKAINIEHIVREIRINV